MIAVIDNYDSFTYNLVQFLGELILQQQVPGTYTDREIRVWRNDEIDVEELADLKPTHIVISPGPGTPDKDSGISNDVIRILGSAHTCSRRLLGPTVHWTRLWRTDHPCATPDARQG